MGLWRKVSGRAAMQLAFGSADGVLESALFRCKVNVLNAFDCREVARRFDATREQHDSAVDGGLLHRRAVEVCSAPFHNCSDCSCPAMRRRSASLTNLQRSQAPPVHRSELEDREFRRPFPRPREDALDHRNLLNGGDDIQLAAAVRAVFKAFSCAGCSHFRSSLPNDRLQRQHPSGPCASRSSAGKGTDGLRQAAPSTAACTQGHGPRRGNVRSSPSP